MGDTFGLWVQMAAIAFHNFYFLGFLAGAFLLAMNAKDDSTSKTVFTILGFVSLLPIVGFLVAAFLPVLGIDKANLSGNSSIIFAVCVMISFGIAFIWLRFGVRKFDVISEKLTARSELERNQKTDAREMEKYIPTSALNFDPLEYINLKKGTFIGLDEKKQPKYIPIVKDKPCAHIQVVGTTGAGKGVILCVLASQFLDQGEAVFFCDPKNDEWAPSVLYASAQRTGKPYYYINLNRPHGAQFNLFEGATEDEGFELFQAGFALTEKGDASDFYGIQDRQWAQRIAKQMAEGNLTIAEVYAQNEAALHDEELGAAKFAGRLREMANTPSINAKSGGVSLEKVIEEGGCVYVVGSMRNDIVKTAQRILLIRLIQLAERRDRMADVAPRRVAIVLDEVKYHLSRPALEALGAARDKGVHVVLAHQSLGDLKDCTKDLNPDAVVDAVVENCKIKIAYQVQNPDTAEWMAKSSKKIQVDDEVRKVTRNLAHAEVVDDERTIKQAERYLVDENMLMSLVPSTAAVYGLGLTHFVSIRPLKVKKSREAIKVYEVAGGTVKTTSDKIGELPTLE